MQREWLAAKKRKNEKVRKKNSGVAPLVQRGGERNKGRDE